MLTEYSRKNTKEWATCGISFNPNALEVPATREHKESCNPIADPAYAMPPLPCPRTAQGLAKLRHVLTGPVDTSIRLTGRLKRRSGLLAYTFRLLK